MAETRKFVKVSALITEELHERVRVAAARTRSTVGAIVAHGVELAVADVKAHRGTVKELRPDGRALRYAKIKANGNGNTSPKP